MARVFVFGLGRLVFSVWVVSLLVFGLVRATGDPRQLLLPEQVTREEYDRYGEILGLNRPAHEQYAVFLGGVLRGDFGISTKRSEPALALVLDRLPATVELGGTAILLSVLLGIPAGVFASIGRGRLADLLVRSFAVLGQSVPVFALGMVLLLVLGVWLRLVPIGGRGSLPQLLLPAFCLGWYTTAGIMRITRSSMLEILEADYVRVARMKGLSERLVVWRHAFRNAALSVLTFAAVLWIPLVAGSVVTEIVFAWPGMGALLVDAVQWRDYPVVQTVVLLMSAMIATLNFLVDCSYAYLDPRLRGQA